MKRTDQLKGCLIESRVDGQKSTCGGKYVNHSPRLKAAIQRRILIIFIYNFRVMIKFYGRIVHQAFKIKNEVKGYDSHQPFRDLKTAYSLVNTDQQTLLYRCEDRTFGMVIHPRKND